MNRTPKATLGRSGVIVSRHYASCHVSQDPDSELSTREMKRDRPEMYHTKRRRLGVFVYGVTKQ